jgi:hypothetical protein
LINAPGLKKRLGKLCDALRSQEKLALGVLDLRDNGLNEYTPVRQLLKENHSIKELNLFGNYIDDKSIEVLWSGLYNNTSVTKLTYAPGEDMILEQSVLD